MIVKQLVGDVVGNAWLSKELEKINSYNPPKKLRKLSFIDYTEKFHPLAFLIYQADKQLKTCLEKKFFEVSEQILRLSYLGENLFVLKNQNTKGLDGKIRDLTSSDKALFDKTTYEIEVAAAYARKGYSVEFVETKSKEGEKTPDLLVNKEVEVECKKKDRKTDRDIRNTEYWKLIVRKASGIMEHFGLNYAVFIKTQRDPEKEDVEFILRQLQKLIKEKKQGRFAFRDRGIGITLQILSLKDQEIESKGIEFSTSEELDYVVSAVEKYEKKENGKIFIRNPRIFGFKSAVLPERITSVIESIKDAKQQLSGKRPGLIYVNLNMIDRKMIDRDFKRLDSLIKRLLKNNSTISGVIVTTEYFVKDAQGYIYSHKARVIRNEWAKYSLPSEFEIVGEKGN
ncbi:MAG TPA: hypothetical protein ENG50_04540 [Candidatus Altiarchaeales archaeon]|nr:hypothetical protein [Candidatus Altiarchaeales archaeon]